MLKKYVQTSMENVPSSTELSSNESFDCFISPWMCALRWIYADIEGEHVYVYVLREKERSMVKSMRQWGKIDEKKIPSKTLFWAGETAKVRPHVRLYVYGKVYIITVSLHAYTRILHGKDPFTSTKLFNDWVCICVS